MTKEIKRLVVLITSSILFISLSSCKKNNDLIGTWIMAFNLETNDSPVVHDSKPYIRFLTFDGENYTFLIIGPSGYLETFEGKYLLESNKLKLLESNKKEADKERFDLVNFISQDSIIISNGYGFNKEGYIRIPDNLKTNKNRLNLKGNSFIREDIKLNDTITFLNDSIYKSSSLIIESSSGQKNIYWKRLNHNNFDLLHLEYFSPYIISVRDSVISLNDVINDQKIILQSID